MFWDGTHGIDAGRMLRSGLLAPVGYERRSQTRIGKLRRRLFPFERFVLTHVKLSVATAAATLTGSVLGIIKTVLG